MIRVILVEDHKIMLASLAALLDKYDHIEVVAEVNSAKELFTFLEDDPKADVIIADVMMPKMDGIEMLTELKQKNVKIPVVLLSMLEDEKHSSAAFLAGANAYLSKNVEVEELLFAIGTVLKGKRYFASELGINILERYHKQLKNFGAENSQNISFSERELSVLKLIAEGKTNQQIADDLFLSRRTVEGIRQSILDRTGAKNTAALIKFAIFKGYIAS
ncbi:response regulator transcription factor [Pedobacter frigiditerrae]|uniref:response regulator transcription factor n=1 Tax=Pedobacter frigiditerrae TaxID=2530452 RepID=UPI00292E9FFE|nr:response regulator transcription factor [Pedobacter frigiditerrae]